MLRIAVFVSLALVGVGCGRRDAVCERTTKMTTSSAGLRRDARGAPAEAEPRPTRAKAAPQARTDSLRLSDVGSAADRDRNLGLDVDGGAGAPTIVLPPSQAGAGAIAPAPPPTTREGAGRPGGAADRFY